MANTKAVYVRIDNDLKEEAEGILEKLGLTPSAAISMFYKQIIMKNGIPFQVRIPYDPPLDISKMTEEEIAAEVLKGYEDIKSGREVTLEQLKTELFEEFGI